MTTLSPAEVLALTVWGEARGEAVEGRIAVACVIRNRLRAGRWGPDYVRVCLAPQQFSCWNADGSANHQALMAQALALQQGQTPADPILRECAWIAAGCLADQVQDRVQGATHYYRSDLAVTPAWAVGVTPVCYIGHHSFCAGVA